MKSINEVAEIVLVVGIAQNEIIGSNNAMPWKLPTDLKRFKKLTLGKPVIMGRKTFDSIGKALPGRLNVVISRSRMENPDVAGVSSLEAAITVSRNWAADNDADQICIIGGGEIYRQALPLANRLYVTHILASPQGDVSFPKIEESNWQIISSEKFPATKNDTAETVFVEYERL